MSFFEIAEPLIARGLPVIPLRPRSKIAALDNWPDLATTDISQIQKWNQEMPDANCACVAQANPDGFWVWEVDSPEAVQRCEQETGQRIPKTFRVRSRIGRGHIFFRHSTQSLAVGNISQAYVKGGDWSARMDRQYCVSAGSLHPLTGKPYEIVSTAEIIEAPPWLVKWLESQKIDKGSSGPTENIKKDSNGLIPRGSIHGFMLHEAGRMRNLGMNAAEIEPVLLRLVHENCQGPIDDDKVCAMARSIEKYEVKNSVVLFDGIVAGTPPVVSVVEPEEMEDVPTFVVPSFPVFPLWTLQETSIYRGLVEPYCSRNSRYEEMMFMPAMTIMLAYLGTKVRIENRDVIPSFYLGMIGKKGKVIKSSSVQDAINYFRYMGIADHAGPSTRNAEGKVLIWTAGSPEGLGIELQRTNCKNSILFYDELSILTNKAGIESSTLIPALLTLYESGNFSNSIKSKKESFSLTPGSYCNSLIFCCTDKNFKTLWGKMSGVTSGLNDRMFFLYQREKFKDVTPPVSVNTQDGALETRKLIDKAVIQGVYRITDSSPLAARMNGNNRLENRQEIRAEKLALGFAVDLGRDEIDEECIERALAIIEYEQAVKRKLRPSEALTKEAAIQNEIVDFLLGHPGGVVQEREITRNLHPERYGTTMWGQAYRGLIQSGQIKTSGTGKKSDPKIVTLLRAPEETED